MMYINNSSGKKIRNIVLSISAVIGIVSFLPKAGYNIDSKHGKGELEFTFDYTLTTPLLRPPYISAVMNDPSDPASTQGFIVDVQEEHKDIPAEEYSISTTSDNAAVVRNENILITKSPGKASIKIIPSSCGYSNIVLKLTKGKQATEMLINYAASVSQNMPNGTFWHTGISDASAAIAIDSEYMIIADDETNQLCVFHRYQSGLPVTVFNYENLLGLTDGEKGNYKEIDCEAAAASIQNPGRIYWMGSMSNGGKKFNIKPNRDCLFATDITGSGAATKFNFKGTFNNLRKQMVTWGDNNGYKLSSAAQGGRDDKQIDGFNIEGMAFAPDTTTLYIGFRAPMVPLSNRANALIAPIKNFEAWFNNGNPQTNADIATPIELNLGGRGIRDIIKTNDGKYIIIAGNSDAKKNTCLYTWTGKRTDTPVQLGSENISLLNAEGGMEIIKDGKPTGNIQLISDNGTAIYYNDSVIAKYLRPDYKKFRSDIIKLQ